MKDVGPGVRTRRMKGQDCETNGSFSWRIFSFSSSSMMMGSLSSLFSSTSPQEYFLAEGQGVLNAKDEGPQVPSVKDEGLRPRDKRLFLGGGIFSFPWSSMTMGS